MSYYKNSKIITVVLELKMKTKILVSAPQKLKKRCIVLQTNPYNKSIYVNFLNQNCCFLIKQLPNYPPEAE